MFTITNISHRVVTPSGKVLKKNILVKGCRLTPGGTASFAEMPTEILPLVYDKVKNPNGFLEVLEVKRIDSGLVLVSEISDTEIVEEIPNPPEPEKQPDVVTVQTEEVSPAPEVVGGPEVVEGPETASDAEPTASEPKKRVRKAAVVSE